MARPRQGHRAGLRSPGARSPAGRWPAQGRRSAATAVALFLLRRGVVFILLAAGAAGLVLAGAPLPR